MFAKGGWYCLKEQASLGYEVLGVDWTVDPSYVKSILSDKNITVQGNLDPIALQAPKEDLQALVRKMINAFGTERYIVNLGHGIQPDAPIDSVQYLVDTVHEFGDEA